MRRHIALALLALVAWAGIVGAQATGVTNVKQEWSAGNLVFKERVTGNGAQVIFGSSGDGLDVKFWGDTAGVYSLWDESADSWVNSNITQSFTLGAANYFKVDGATTAHTETTGVFQLNLGGVTANTKGLALSLTQNNGTSSGANMYAAVVTLTGNDADGDVDGILVNAAATANAAAGTYEYGFAFDCAENTGGSCLDGFVATSTGASSSLVDGFDASDSDITNAINIGSNLIAGGNSDTFAVGATDATATLDRNDSGAGTYTCTDDDANANCVFAAGGTGTSTLGSATSTAATIATDGTGDAELTVPAQSISGTEMANDTIDFAQIDDTPELDGDLTITAEDGEEVTLSASYTTGDSEALTILVSQVDDAAATDDAQALAINLASESNDGGDTIKGIVITGTDGTANTVMDAAVAIDNQETTAATLTDGVIVTSSGVNSGVTDAFDASAANIDNAINIGANLIAGGNGETLAVGATDATVTLDRNDSGAGTYTCTDDDANADCVFAAGGTGGATVGAATNASVTLSTDNTGDGTDLVAPENGIGSDEAAVPVDQVVLCGELHEDGTTTLGPATALFGGDGTTSYALGGAGCDALDNETEATADNPLTGYGAFKVVGMWCRTDGTLAAGESIVYTARSAEGNLVPSVTCTIGEAAQTCRTMTATTTDVAAGATIAVNAAMTSNNADDNGWCKLYVQMQ